jgi:tetratricopeptide (TPR) repeat protein
MMTETKDPTLMEVLARDQWILPGSEKEKQAAENFAANLDDILKLAGKQAVPVVLSTLVANLKDHQPFVSVEIKDPQTQELYRQAINLVEQEQHKQALAILWQLQRGLSEHAGIHYLLGKALLKSGQTEKALEAFQQARDADLLRFRAPSAFNTIIKNAARENDCVLIDMESIFQAAAEDGIPGDNLFFEHLHPTFDGYRLMAQTFYEALKKIQIINPPKKIGWQEQLFLRSTIRRITETYKEENGSVTALDLEFGALRNYILTSRWPFPYRSLDLSAYQPVGSEMTKQLAADHVQNKIYWDEAHYRMGDYYLKREEFPQAIAEYRAVNLSFYDNPLPFKKIGIAYEAHGMTKRAISFYKRSLERKNDDPQVMAQMGRLMAIENRFREAVPHLQGAIQHDTAQSIFTVEQNAVLNYLLAFCQANLRQWPEAETNLQKALKLNPNLQAAQELQLQMEKMQKR